MVFPFSAKTYCLIAILMVLGQRSDAAVLLGTDFSGRTTSGATASNLTYTLNGFANPGDLTALQETPEDKSNFGGLFDTFSSYNFFAVDRNVGNEGPWSVDVPLVLTVAQLHIFDEGITAGRGWIAVALVIFSRWRPVLALGGALLFGIANALQFRIQALNIEGIPYEFLLMLPYALTILVLLQGVRKAETPSALGTPYVKE